MCIYKCEKPVSHCHHHGEYVYEQGGVKEKDLDLEYQAYRFKFVLQAKDRHLFKGLTHQKFYSTERGMPLEGFGGHRDAQGTIFRKWEWVPTTDPSLAGTEG